MANITETSIEELMNYIKERGLSEDFADWKLTHKTGDSK